jgi:type IV pilus assembly protein PilE
MNIQYSSRRRIPAGFTLIELMIVVAIIAIIAAIAYPSYTSSIIKGKRSQGRGALLDLLQQQERYMTQYGSYMTFGAGKTGANGTVFGSTSTSVNIPFKTTSGDNPSSAAYDLGAEVCDSSTNLRECVRVVAVPNFSDPVAGTLYVESTGVRLCRGGTDTSVCWK